MKNEGKTMEYKSKDAQSSELNSNALLACAWCGCDTLPSLHPIEDDDGKLIDCYDDLHFCNDYHRNAYQIEFNIG